MGRPGPPRSKKSECVFSIGIYSGRTPVRLGPEPGARNPVLHRDHVTDVSATFVADPFMLRVDGRWFMFFEVHNRRLRKGQIGLAQSKDGLRWTYERVVLDEPFHLSYPYVFEWHGEHFMIPETGEAGEVRLYRAERFPGRWTFFKTLLYDFRGADASILHSDGKWWLFASDGATPFKADNLHLFFADDVLGPWREHPASPVLRGEPRIARPAGRLVKAGGRIFRYAQDCSSAYGTQVFAFEILELTPERFRQRETPTMDPVLRGSGNGWNKQGMHHIDLHQVTDSEFIACVDGWVMSEDLP